MDAESVNGFKDEDGCPDRVPKPLSRVMGKLDGVYFEKMSAILRKRSDRTLYRTVKVLKRFAQVRISVEGHTDNRGARTFNVELSRQRADAVRLWLIAHGVPTARLVAVGHGPDKPIASNSNRRGRATNRRVELVIIPPQLDDPAAPAVKPAAKPAAKPTKPAAKPASPAAKPEKSAKRASAKPSSAGRVAAKTPETRANSAIYEIYAPRSHVPRIYVSWARHGALL